MIVSTRKHSSMISDPKLEISTNTKAVRSSFSDAASELKAYTEAFYHFNLSYSYLLKKGFIVT